jgi:hypothetical protein
MIFEKYATIGKPWIISDSIISYFDVDKNSAKEYARQWWAAEGNFNLENTGPASDQLDEKTYKTWKDYAVLEAGREKVRL